MSEYCNILENTEEGFVDLTFDINEVRKKLFGNTIIDCVANFNGRNIGFSLEIKKGMKGVVNNDFNNISFYKDGLKIIYLKPVSDDFISCILTIYGFEQNSIILKNETVLEACALKGNPGNIQNEAVDFKCFLGAEEKYSEFFINIDIPERKLYLREKDPEYRANIIINLSRVQLP